MKIPPYSRDTIIALFSGALLPLALAPYSYWLLGIISTTILAALLKNLRGRQALIRSFAYGLGLFCSGSSWVYISIHDFGFTAAPLAVVLTGVFVGFLALVFSLPFALYGRYLSKSKLSYYLVFPALWVLGEWLRSWLFTGFPWLYLGYSHIDTVLGSWAPITGVFSLSFFSVLSGTLAVQVGLLLPQIWHNKQHNKAYKAKSDIVKCVSGVTIIATVWISGLTLNNVQWTEPFGEAQSVAIMQPNVPLHEKWNPIYHGDIMQSLEDSAAQHWDKSIQVWPEAAIPGLYHSMQYFIDLVAQDAKASQTNIFSGVLYDQLEPLEIYNGIIGLGEAEGLYFKQKLVPFGEYMPFEEQLRGLIHFFDLPSSIIRLGPYKPDALNAVMADGRKYAVSAFICYEIVYPDFVSRNAHNANLMLTISNDAWFGDSIGPLQHFEMARMRALENQKSLIRATNTGISAIIDRNGIVTKQSVQFEKDVLTGEVYLYKGTTPFNHFGSVPILLLCFGLILFALGYRHKSASNAN